MRNRRGFTLLELLVVIAILAAISFIAAGTFRGVGAHADERLVLTEMQEIAKALRQFKQDTGYYPREGPFALGATSNQEVTDADLATVAHSGSTAAARARWFNSPANFYQLLVGPLLSGHVQNLETWNAETGRGWRGPYLRGFADGRVDIGDDINASVDGIDGDPLTGNSISNVDGIADPFEYRPAGGLLDWTGVDAGEPWGRPYLFLQNAAGRWVLISMGPDGEYDQGGGDDIVLPIE